jgi:hypothetical protein
VEGCGPELVFITGALEGTLYSARPCLCLSFTLPGQDPTRIGKLSGPDNIHANDIDVRVLGGQFEVSFFSLVGRVLLGIRQNMAPIYLYWHRLYFRHGLKGDCRIIFYVVFLLLSGHNGPDY